LFRNILHVGGGAAAVVETVGPAILHSPIAHPRVEHALIAFVKLLAGLDRDVEE
jgi:hypothetical protein